MDFFSNIVVRTIGSNIHSTNNCPVSKHHILPTSYILQSPMLWAHSRKLKKKVPMELPTTSSLDIGLTESLSGVHT